MQSLDSLRRIISPSPYLAIAEPASGWPIVQVAHPAATATLALHGAHLMSWQLTDAKTVIYTSPGPDLVTHLPGESSPLLARISL
jgi:D-hexose-6-phosphate mutarotase